MLVVHAFPEADDALLDDGAEREIEAAIELTRGVRRWRDLVGVAAGQRAPARAPTGRRAAPRAGRPAGAALVRRRRGRGDGDVRAGRGPGLGRGRRGRGPRPDRASAARRFAAEVERAERKLANEGFVAQGAGRGRRGGAREARRLPGRARGARLSRVAYADAEAYLASLEPLGWRFGLERMRRLVSLLGMPQHRFASIHVVGTNGKSSVAEMTAALLEAHGARTGAYLSPHIGALVRAGSDRRRRDRRRRRSPRRSSGSRRRSRSSNRTLDGGRVRDPVRGGDRGRVRRASPPRGSRSR